VFSRRAPPPGAAYFGAASKKRLSSAGFTLIAACLHVSWQQ
jgi:hypothetical protein